MKPRKLTKKQFDRALKNGLGAAFLHVKKYGDRGLEKELIQSCLTNYVYDRQTCHSRGYWLAKILDHTNNIEHYAAAVKTALDRAPNRGKDFEQLIVLATELFERGFDEFKGILLRLQPEISYQGGTLKLGMSLIDVASFSGFDAAARMMVLKNTEIWEKAALFEYFSEELLNCDETKAVAYLNERVPEDLVLSEFWTEVQSDLADNEHKKSLERSTGPKVSIDQIILPTDEIVQFQRFGNHYRRFGKTATDEELRSVLEEFERETEKVRLYNYLAVFWDRELPVVPRRVFDLLKSDSKDLRLAARNALSMIKSPAIRKLALQALEESLEDDWIVIGVKLLKRNFRINDASLLQALKKIIDIDSQHWATTGVIEIAETVDNTKLTDLMIFVFETTPCDHCRATALQKLVDWNTASDQMLYEAQWDVSYLVQRIARNTVDVCS